MKANMLIVVAVAALVALALPSFAQGTERGDGRVYDENVNQLPPGCEQFSEEIDLVIRGGTQYAVWNGTTYAFDQQDLDYPACARVHVTFHNDDEIRHMFMVHGVYPNGTFLIEVDGPGTANGTFIVPFEKQTLLLHCGIPGHQEKGMKGQIRVDGGVGDLPTIPGVSGLPKVGSENVFGPNPTNPSTPETTAAEKEIDGLVWFLLGIVCAFILVFVMQGGKRR